jgi:predicted nucleotide-binding protein
MTNRTQLDPKFPMAFEDSGMSITEADLGTTVTITLPDRAKILRVAEVFERRASESVVTEPVVVDPPRIFIGHGRSGQWRDLKDHLQDQHHYTVVAYETGARAGHEIRDILEEMLEASSFAVLLHTAEDETSDGSKRARQNVIHETGLFQGRLGFGRAIVLFEEGAEDYSNLDGVQQIRYSAGNIKETYGDVLATLRREFH